MALAATSKRVTRLEGIFVVDRLTNYPPLSNDEIEELVERLAGGRRWSDTETARVARQCPYIHGELLITTGLLGEVTIKRYPGLDVAWI